MRCDNLPPNVLKKLKTLSQALDFPSDAAAARGLGIPRSTIRKWQGQVDNSSWRKMRESLNQYPGPKACPPKWLRNDFDRNEGMALCFHRHFPRWTAAQIALALKTVGCPTSVEAVVNILTLHHGGAIPARYTADSKDENSMPSDGEALMNMLLTKMVGRLVDEAPARAAAVLVEEVENRARYGLEIVNILREYCLSDEDMAEAEEITREYDALTKDCKALLESSKAARNELSKVGRVNAPDGEPGQDSKDPELLDSDARESKEVPDKLNEVEKQALEHLAQILFGRDSA